MAFARSPLSAILVGKSKSLDVEIPGSGQRIDPFFLGNSGSSGVDGFIAFGLAEMQAIDL